MTICGNIELSGHLENRIIIRNIKTKSDFLEKGKNKSKILHFKLAK
jgi:hypothetical protein